MPTTDTNLPMPALLTPRAPAKGFSYGLHVLRRQPTNGLTHRSRSRSKYTRHVGKKQLVRTAQRLTAARP